LGKRLLDHFITQFAVMVPPWTEDFYCWTDTGLLSARHAHRSICGSSADSEFHSLTQ
jgi:hypothetical protein